MRAVLVARVSSFRQAEAVSLEVQIETMRGFVDSLKGEVVAEYLDSVPGTEGRYEDRVGLRDALALLEDGVADTVVIHDVTRGARDDVVFNRLLTDVYSKGGKLGVAFERQVYQSKSDAEQHLYWQKSVSTYEVMTLRRRTQMAKKKSIDNGGFLWKPMFGYRLERTNNVKTLVANEPRAIIVREVFEKLASGTPKSEIVASLHARGLHIDVRTVTTMAANADIYAGGTKDYSVTLDGDLVTRTYRFPQLVDRAIAQRVKSTARTNYRSKRIPTPFLGVARCICGKGVVLARRYASGSQLTCSTTAVARYHEGQGRKAPPAHRHSVSAMLIAEQVSTLLGNTAANVEERV